MSIQYQGVPAEVVFKEITAGDETEIINRCVGKLKLIAGEIGGEIDFALYREILVLKSLKEAPFRIDAPTIKSLDRSTFAQLYTRSLKINPFDLGGLESDESTS